MAGYGANDFATTILRDLDARRSGTISMSSMSETDRGIQTKALGHPDFEHLEVGEKRTASVTCVFIDLSDFTGRSFWDPNDEVADLAHAVLSGFIEVISLFGGHPLGLRGDGLFAGFGPGGDDTVNAVLALGACALALDGIQNTVNPRLKERGIYPVQARAGLDFGEITFVRSGTATRSEINPLGFAANFAAKCEKKANSWEIVVGQGLKGIVPADTLFTAHADSPKRFTRDYVVERYAFYDYNWKSSLKHLPGITAELAGHSSSTIRVN